MAENTSAETQTADEQTDNSEDERTEYVWVNQSPDTRITGTPVELIYAGELGSDVEQNKTSFGVVLEDVEVDGSIFRNTDKPDEGVTMVEGDRGREYHQTDYKVADADDSKTTVVDGGGVDTGNGIFTAEEVEDFDEEQILVWYNGMSGQIVGRGLDFNGRPYARYTDDGYLIKGLYQCAEGWRNATNKKSMVDANKAPRVARAPVLRDDIDQISIRIKRSDNNPKAYWVDMGPSADEEFDRDNSMLYDADADEVLAEHGIDMNLYHGDGWQDKPANAETEEDAEDNPFDGMSIDDGLPEHLEALNNEERKFLTKVVEDARRKNVTDASHINLASLAGRFSELFEEAPDIDALSHALEVELEGESDE